MVIFTFMYAPGAGAIGSAVVKFTGLFCAATAGDLASCRIQSLHHHFHFLAQMIGIIDSLNFTLSVKSCLKSLGLLRFRNGIDHGERRRIGAPRVLESEDAIVLHFLQEGPWSG